MDLTKPLMQQEFADLVGVTQPAVSELVAQGVLVTGQPASEWLLAYCKRLREEAAGRDNELSRERARLAREQADGVAMKNALMRREFAPIAMLETALARVSRQIAAVLEALPTKLRRRVTHLTAEDMKAIEDEIAVIRNLARDAVLEEPDESLLEETEKEVAAEGSA